MSDNEDLNSRALMYLVTSHLAELSEGEAHDWLEAADLRAALRRCKRRHPHAMPLERRVKLSLQLAPCGLPATQPLPEPTPQPPVASPSLEPPDDAVIPFDFVCPSSQPEPVPLLEFGDLLRSLVITAEPALRFEFFRTGAALEVLRVDECPFSLEAPVEFTCLGCDVEVCKDTEQCTDQRWLRKFDFNHAQTFFPHRYGRFTLLEFFQAAAHSDPHLQVRFEPSGGYLLMGRHSTPVRKNSAERYIAVLLAQLNERLWETLDQMCSPPVPHVFMHTTGTPPVYRLRSEHYSHFTDRVNALMVL